MENNLFRIIMEAETDDQLQSFDGGTDQGSQEQQMNPPVDSAAPESGYQSDPPPLNDDSDMGFEDAGGTDQMQEIDETDGSSDNEKMSVKTSNLLNQQLYEKLSSRNSEIEKYIDSISTILPIIPFENTDVSDKYIQKLRDALYIGQDYAINNFSNKDYGENNMFFIKLDQSYSLILDELNMILKKIK